MYLQKPKKRSSKTKLDSKIIQRNEKDERHPKVLLLNSSNKHAITEKCFIICRSCFWYYPVNNYIIKGINNQQHAICPLCADNNIKYLLIPHDRLFKYISTKIN